MLAPIGETAVTLEAVTALRLMRAGFLCVALCGRDTGRPVGPWLL